MGYMSPTCYTTQGHCTLTLVEKSLTRHQHINYQFYYFQPLALVLGTLVKSGNFQSCRPR